jgi:hypothetical protein
MLLATDAARSQCKLEPLEVHSWKYHHARAAGRAMSHHRSTADSSRTVSRFLTHLDCNRVVNSFFFFHF